MPRDSRPRPGKATSSGGRSGPSLVPCLMLRRGKVCLPGPAGPVEARTPGGEPYDPFDVVDRLSEDYPLLYVVDLDGIERGEVQLDYLQELSRDVGLWVDAGVRHADQAIDVLVAGARRAVLSTASLAGPKELKRAWRLSTEFVFEVEFTDAHNALAAPAWESTNPEALASVARAVGVQEVVLSPRGEEPDWALVHRIAAGGPTWVNGTFDPSESSRLVDAGAVGGIFHLDTFLATWIPTAPEPPTPSDDPRAAR
jgi:hypothetical protein